MNDKDYGKKIAEEMIMESLTDSFEMITDLSITGIKSSESPDFLANIGGLDIGIELAEIRDQTDAFDYKDEAYRIVDKKNESYSRRGLFKRQPIMLVLYSYSPPLFDIKDQLDQLYLGDFQGLGFHFIWLMDLSDEYFSAGDPRRPADLYCLSPREFQGFHRFGDWARKPFG